MNSEKLIKMAKALSEGKICHNEIGSTLRAQSNEYAIIIDRVIKESKSNNEEALKTTAALQILRAYRIIEGVRSFDFSPGDIVENNGRIGVIQSILPLTESIIVKYPSEIITESIENVTCKQKSALSNEGVTTKVSRSGQVHIGNKSFTPANSFANHLISGKQVDVICVEKNNTKSYYLKMESSDKIPLSIPLVETIRQEKIIQDNIIKKFPMKESLCVQEQVSLIGKEQITSEAIMSIDGDPAEIMKLHDIVLKNLHINNVEQIITESMMQYKKLYRQQPDKTNLSKLSKKLTQISQMRKSDTTSSQASVATIPQVAPSTDMQSQQEYIGMQSAIDSVISVASENNARKTETELLKMVNEFAKMHNTAVPSVRKNSNNLYTINEISFILNRERKTLNYNGIIKHLAEARNMINRLLVNENTGSQNTINQYISQSIYSLIGEDKLFIKING